MKEILLLSIGENLYNNTNSVIVFNGKTYNSLLFEISSIQRNANMKPDEVIFKVVYGKVVPNSQTVMQLFESRTFELSKLINGQMDIVMHGVISNIQTKTTGAEIAGQSMLYKLKRPITQRYSQKCRASFCDAECSLAIENHTHTVFVSSVKLNNITVSDDLPLKYWQNSLAQISVLGTVHYMPVRGVNGREVLFFDALPTGVQVGDEIKVQASCSKLLATCAEIYNNAVNFRGEPFIWR